MEEDSSDSCISTATVFNCVTVLFVCSCRKDLQTKVSELILSNKSLFGRTLKIFFQPDSYMLNCFHI